MVEETFFDGIESWRVDQHPPLVLERGQMAPNARVICVVAAPPSGGVGQARGRKTHSQLLTQRPL